ncbi:MAG: glycosyl hydrolase-related protein [Opitutales bacterium]|nr:glycosyl hydrolase-related protein [Opitutales bacterium]
MKKNVHIVCYTHWDREFRWQFEQTRMALVECLDNLFEIIEEKPAYRSFLLDGQVQLLHDYLEIRPEKETQIREFIADNRLEVGPWYSLPDCGAINGESVIRNLKYGMEVSADFGSVLNCGYNVFSFGQIGQLPQIYNQFGIDIAIFYKYLNPARCKEPEFIWESPDGSRLLASRLGPEARWNFFFAGHIPIVYDRDPWDKNWRYEYGDLGKPFHTADPEGYGWFHEILDPETSFHKENINEGFERSLETVKNTSVPETLLFFNGTDFTEPHPLTPEIIEELQKQCGDDYNIRHSSLTAYLDELKSYLAKRADLQVIQGPMRDGPVGHVHSDVLSVHPELKISNSIVENQLIRFAEPLSTLAYASDISAYPKTYLDKIWKLLFESHAHDSIHGLGPAALAKGGLARLEQAKLICEGLERKALGNLTKEIHTQDVEGTSIFLAVHNTTTFPRSEVVEAWIDIPQEIPLEEVIITDENGNQCAIQEIQREVTRAGIYHARSRNMPFHCHRVALYFWTNQIPSLGYKTFRIGWKAKSEYPYPHEDFNPPKVIQNDLLAGPRSAKNEFLSLNINSDGTFDIQYFETGKSYRNLNYLYDTGDCGNMWMFNEPSKNQSITSVGNPAKVSCLEHGPLVAKFSVETKLEVPAELSKCKMSRSANTVFIESSSVITIRTGSRYVEVENTIKNTAKNHHLKVCFPTGMNTERTSADGSFSVAEYSTEPDLSKDLARHPLQLWLSTHDNENALSILSRSTKDYEMLDESGGKTIALGLLRGVELRIPCDNRLWMDYPGDESAQSLGESTHHYAIMPHKNDWNTDQIYKYALCFNQPLKPCQFGKQNGCLPREKSFLEIENSHLVLGAIKKSDLRESVIVRIFNPSKADQKTKIKCGFPFEKAYLNQLNETALEELPVEGNEIQLDVSRGKIVTIECYERLD